MYIRQQQNDRFNYLFFGAFSGTFGQINIGLLEHNIGITTADTFDGGHGNGNLTFTIDIRIHDTKDVLKLFRNYQRLQKLERSKIRIAAHELDKNYRRYLCDTHSIC